jgi:LmbE family N-acetylglucosaminyl deacetylase
MPAEELRLLILGAHPDDGEFHAGGLAALYRDLGHQVKMVSVNNGDAGHQRMAGPELSAIRRAEAAASGEVIGAAYEVWDYPDGALEASLEVRRSIIREIRLFRPDLCLTHRPNDYHPDHRAVGQAVQDASYMVTVPAVVPEAPALRRDPVVAYLPDLFTRPAPLEPHVVLDITGQLDTVVRMLACHRSQVFDWLPYHEGRLEEVPAGEEARLAWLRSWYLEKIRPFAERYRRPLLAAYGRERGSRIEACHVFEISEYARPLDDAARRRLFPEN